MVVYAGAHDVAVVAARCADAISPRACVGVDDAAASVAV